MRFLIFEMLMRLKRYWMKHKLLMRLEMLILMLDNNAPFAEIRTYLKLKVSSLQEVYRLLFKQELEGVDAYICLKISIKDRFLKQNLIKKILIQNAYSFILIMCSLAMFVFYSLEFHPLIAAITADFGHHESALPLQLFLVNGVLVGVGISGVIGVVLGVFALQFRAFFTLILLRNSKLFKMLTTSRLIHHYHLGFHFYHSLNMTHRMIKGLFRKDALSFLIDSLDAKMDQGHLIFQNLDPWLFDGYLNMVSAGYSKIDMDALYDAYFDLTMQRINMAVKTLSRILKLVAILFVGMAIYVFYTSLLIPLKVMEAL